jgi:hypothetical protein
MSGEPDPLYVIARTVLLDTIEALGAQRDAIILIGAQAIYMHTGSIEFAVAEYTTDADVAIDPGLLRSEPEIASALIAAGFTRRERVGAWVITKQINGIPVEVEVDLMVPQAVSGPGKRAARLPGHTAHSARKARGLEAVLVDKALKIVGAIDASDPRAFPIFVAGPAGLMVTKLHKIRERLSERRRSRLNDKDALDVLRLLQAVPTAELARMFRRLLNAQMAGDVTSEAIEALEELFLEARRPGAQMAEQAAAGLVAEGQIAQSCAILTRDLLSALGQASAE